MNKVEIFKRHFNNLLDRGDYKKVGEFVDFLRDYFQRKGQKTEFVYVVSFFVDSIDEITDKV